MCSFEWGKVPEEFRLDGKIFFDQNEFLEYLKEREKNAKNIE